MSGSRPSAYKQAAPTHPTAKRPNCPTAQPPNRPNTKTPNRPGAQAPSQAPDQAPNQAAKVWNPEGWLHQTPRRCLSVCRSICLCARGRGIPNGLTRF
eukprot:119080-Chlamydomonas_euryale.AAC.1